MATKDKTLQIRLSEKEYSSVVNLANSHGKNPSDYVRTILEENVQKYLDRSFTLINDEDFKNLLSPLINNVTQQKLHDLTQIGVEVEDSTN